MAEKKSAKDAEKRGGTQKKVVRTAIKKRASKASAKKTTARATKAVRETKKPARKTATKKTTAVTKKVRVVKKNTSNGEVSTKQQTPKKQRESVASPYQTEVSDTENDTYPADTVSLPRDASVRAQERAALIAYLTDHNIDRFIERMTKIIGVFILMLGITTSSMSLYVANLVPLDSLQAEVISGTAGTTSESTEGTTEHLPFNPSDLVVEFNIDTTLTAKHDLVVETNAGRDAFAYLKNIHTGAIHELDRTEARPEYHRWEFNINAATIPEGSYVVLAKIYLESLAVETFSQSVQVVHELVPSTDGASSSNDDVTEESETGVNVSSTDPVADITPVVRFVDVPSSITEPTLITVKAVYVDTVALVARDTKRTTAVRLPQVAADTLEDTRTFKIDPSFFAAGEYDIRATAKTSTGSYTFESQSFMIEETAVSTTEDKTDDETDIETVDVSNDDTSTAPDAVTTESTATETLNSPEVRMVFDTIRSTEQYRVYAIAAPEAMFVEMYARPLIASTPVFLGLATKSTDDRYVYTIDTTAVPNGTYLLTARARIGNELVTSQPIEYRVQHTVIEKHDTSTHIAEDVTKQEPIAAIEQVVADVTKASQDDTTETTSERTATDVQDDIHLNEATEDEQGADTAFAYAEQLLDTYTSDIEAALQRYTSALRSGDAVAIEKTKQSLDALTSRMMLEVYKDDQADAYLAHIEQHINTAIDDLAVRTETTERIIKERTSDAIAIDSDQDGITDYDEITIYNTNPNVADTDQDGFIDGAEILSGFDPNDAAYEALIAYESPQDSGVIRDDILVVENVQTILTQPGDETQPARAEITGRALPNSFVTLYIFSTPIIVSVQTTDDGSWSYTFDKELEDGTHDVYVGLTDNTGKVIAKSNPFRFVKEAQAFTPVDVSAATIVEAPEKRPLSSPFTTPLVLGLTLLVIGLMLIMLGYYLERMRPEAAVEAEPA